MKTLYILFPLLAMFFCSHAQTTMWIGPSTGSWSDAANWDAGVPGSTSDIIFDGSNPLLTGGVINIADVSQSNPSGSFNSLKVLNNATVNLSGTTDTYFYLFGSIQIDTGCVVTIGGTTANRFEIGTTDFTSFINIDGTLDMQGTGNSSNPTIFFPTTISFGPPPPVIVTIKGKVILSGANAGFISNTTMPTFENGSELIVTRDGGACPKANFNDGSVIKIQGVIISPTIFNSSAIYDGVLQWDCPGQIIAGSSALLLPSSSFDYFDSLVISNTGTSGSVRLATNPSGYYVKNIVVNGGVLEFGSPTGSSSYTCRVDNIHQTGGMLIGNAAGVAGFDNAFEQDTINIGNFIQDGGIFEFSNRTPVNAMPNASCILQVSGNLKVGGTFKLSQPATAPNCAVVFNGNTNQNFEVTGLYINKVKTVLENTFMLAGVNMLSNVILPDSLVFRQGYLFLNNFNLTNPLPVQAVSNPFQTHVVTNGAGFFVQKNVGTAPVGIPIGASTGTVNPLVIGLFAGTVDIAAKVEVGVNPPSVFPDIAVDRTWQIMPIDFFMPSNLAVSFGYSDLTPLPGDGNVNFSYTSNDEIGLFAGGNWQVISLPGGIAPVGTNPYAISAVIPSSFFIPNVPSPLIVSNESGVVPVANVVSLVVEKTLTGALLKWELAESNSNNNFEVQRSIDGRNFSSLGSMPSRAVVLHYSFSDNTMLAGVNYYRVKISDISGRVKYSVVVAVINKASGIIITSLLPTVVNNNVVVTISSASKFLVQIQITDMLGRVVKKINSILNEGSNQVNINCGTLAKGTYQLSAYSKGNQIKSIRFVKE